MLQDFLLFKFQMLKQTIKKLLFIKLPNYQEFSITKDNQIVLQADKKVIYPIFYYLLT
ncbi:unnamed protein product [Paramecium pentaurelia]|uniref:Uncharacterized protein n=1 Tax=Paramecium pentaurelia TaxID=43138 RepID=A0A8S1UTR3_9CILI|nr:unnamed protein product [Paramecium pentaurelia]